MTALELGYKDGLKKPKMTPDDLRKFRELFDPKINPDKRVTYPANWGGYAGN
jgi:hypothetical protein